MSIQTDHEMDQALEQIQRLYRALAALKAEVLPVNPGNYALLAEGPLDQIRELQAQVDAYVGVATVAAVGEGER